VDKKVVGVFVRFSCASSLESSIEMAFISRFRKENYRFTIMKLAHYANAASDMSLIFLLDSKLEGFTLTDFDLKAHEKFSGRKLQYFDAELNYVPYVVETSVGLDRMFLAVLQLL
jgi:glycyl-tRNA synthetase